METRTFCSSCGAPLAADAPRGLCPSCLMKVALASGTVAETTGGKQDPFTPPAIGELAARFPQLEILELIGRGGMGAVYKARQKELDRIVALKILPPDIGGDAAFAERFAREAKALARLNHPGIVTIYEVGRADGMYYFLMEFVDGVSLRQLLAGGRVSPREALAIVPQICDALQYAHDQGIVHRDIKPANVLLDRRGRVKVADFGLAKLIGGGVGPAGNRASTAGAPTPAEASKVMGTPHYMAPEQVEHPGEVDHRADIYALGVVFYQMLTGELPGRRLEPPSHKVRIDVRLDEVVLRALEKAPERRYQQVSEVKTRLETITAAPRETEAAAGANAGPLPFALPAEAQAVGGELRLASAVLYLLGFASWGVLVFTKVLGYALPAGIAQPVRRFFFTLWDVPTRLGIPALDGMGHLVGTLALLSAWRVRRGRGLALAIVAVFLCFFDFSILPLALPVGILALAILWDQDVRTAFAATEARRRQQEDPAEQRLAYRLAVAGAALVPVSFLCLPVFQAGSYEALQQGGMVGLLLEAMRWLPLWTQGLALVLGMAALWSMRQEGGNGRGIGWALFGALFAPLLFVFSGFWPGAHPWYYLQPYVPDVFEPTLERLFWSQAWAAVAAGILALWAARARTTRIRSGVQAGIPKLTTRACYVAGIASTVYVASFLWSPIAWACRQYLGRGKSRSRLCLGRPVGRTRGPVGPTQT